MQPSPSSSLPAANSRTAATATTATTTALVWTCRLLVGATFVASGVAKAIDLWGFIFKMEQYLAVWQADVPRGVVFTAAATLASLEFLVGFLLITGSYKRTCVWTIALIMAAMLPLSLYIAVANPVADCGCFGDMILLSNPATFVKNLVLAALVAYLIRRNADVAGLFMPINQWLVALMAIVYVISIAIFGYNVQPLIDFRPYPVGTPLGRYAQGDDGGGDDLLPPDYRFIYERGGQLRSFSVDSLPDDTWTFVERVEPPADPADAAAEPTFDGMIAVFDTDGLEATAEAIAADGEQVLLLIPELDGIDVSSTYLVNEVCRHVTSLGGSMAAIIATNRQGVEMWRDLSMASYPIFTADDTSIKEIVRGTIALVYLRDGVIQWKRTLSSIDTELFERPDADTLPSLAFSGTAIMWALTLSLFGLELLLWILDRSGRAVKLHLMRRRRRQAAKQP